MTGYTRCQSRRAGCTSMNWCATRGTPICANTFLQLRCMGRQHGYTVYPSSLLYMLSFDRLACHQKINYLVWHPSRPAGSRKTSHCGTVKYAQMALLSFFGEPSFLFQRLNNHSTLKCRRFQFHLLTPLLSMF